MIGFEIQTGRELFKLESTNWRQPSGNGASVVCLGVVYQETTSTAIARLAEAAQPNEESWLVINLDEGWSLGRVIHVQIDGFRESKLERIVSMEALPGSPYFVVQVCSKPAHHRCCEFYALDSREINRTRYKERSAWQVVGGAKAAYPSECASLTCERELVVEENGQDGGAVVIARPGDGKLFRVRATRGAEDTWSVYAQELTLPSDHADLEAVPVIQAEVTYEWTPAAQLARECLQARSEGKVQTVHLSSSGLVCLEIGQAGRFVVLNANSQTINVIDLSSVEQVKWMTLRPMFPLQKSLLIRDQEEAAAYSEYSFVGHGLGRIEPPYERLTVDSTGQFMASFSASEVMVAQAEGREPGWSARRGANNRWFAGIEQVSVSAGGEVLVLEKNPGAESRATCKISMFDAQGRLVGGVREVAVDGIWCSSLENHEVLLATLAGELWLVDAKDLLRRIERDADLPDCLNWEFSLDSARPDEYWSIDCDRLVIRREKFR